MKTFRLIGIAFLAIVLCVNFTACSDDNEEETFGNIEGTWLLQSSKGYIENSNEKETWNESYPDLQEGKLVITKVSNNKYKFEEYYWSHDGAWEEEPLTYFPELSGTLFTITPHILDFWDTAEIKSVDKTKLVLECIGDDGGEWFHSVNTFVRAK